MAEHAGRLPKIDTTTILVYELRTLDFEFIILQQMRSDMKKVWKKPKLVVLYRGKPEESVLVACKGAGTVWTGPAKNKCRALTGPGSCLATSVT